MPGRKFYIEKYLQRVEECRLQHIEENGDDIGFDSMEYIDTAEQIVGYYIYTYGNEALDKWLENLYHAVDDHDTDREVTDLLIDVMDRTSNKDS